MTSTPHIPHGVASEIERRHSSPEISFFSDTPKKVEYRKLRRKTILITDSVKKKNSKKKKKGENP